MKEKDINILINRTEFILESLTNGRFKQLPTVTQYSIAEDILKDDALIRIFT